MSGGCISLRSPRGGHKLDMDRSLGAHPVSVAIYQERLWGAPLQRHSPDRQCETLNQERWSWIVLVVVCWCILLTFWKRRRERKKVVESDCSHPTHTHPCCTNTHAHAPTHTSIEQARPIQRHNPEATDNSDTIHTKLTHTTLRTTLITTQHNTKRQQTRQTTTVQQRQQQQRQHDDQNGREKTTRQALVQQGVR